MGRTPSSPTLTLARRRLSGGLATTLMVWLMATPAARADVSGTVTDPATVPVSGAVVVSLCSGARDTTDANGAFLLSAAGVRDGWRHGSALQNLGLRIRGRELWVSGVAAGASVHVTMVDMSGRAILNAGAKAQQSGARFALPRLATGACILRADVDGQTMVSRVLTCGQGGGLVAGGNGGEAETSPVVAAAAKACACIGDTVVVSQSGYQTARIGLATADTLVTLVLHTVVNQLNLDADGWSVFTPSVDTRTIYVSSSTGSDSSSGLSENTPVRTIAKGKSLLRNGYPDWLLLKKGDTWKDQGFDLVCLSGRSATEPMLFSSYGTGARPLIETNPLTSTGNNGFYTAGSGGCGSTGDKIAVVGLEFYSYASDPDSPNYDSATGGSGSGYFLLNNTTWMLVENCKFTYAYIVVEPSSAQNVSLRRNVIVDNYNSAGAHSQGIYTHNTVNLLIEGNIFDHNGWNEQITGANSTIFNRNAYLSYGDGNTIYRDNIDASGASGGVQMRCGGFTEDNLFSRDPISIVYGSSENPPQNVPGIICDNVTLDAHDISTQVQGTGIHIQSNSVGPSYIENVQAYGNVVAHNVLGTGNICGISLDGSGPFINTDVHDNIVYDWSRPSWPNPNDHRADGFSITVLASSTNTAFHNNAIQQPSSGFIGYSGNSCAGISMRDNTYYSAETDPPVIWSKGWFELSGAVSWSTWMSQTGEAGATRQQVAYPAPNRTVDTYVTSVGLSGGYDTFMARARQQSRDNWNPRFTAAAVNNYIRAGFGVRVRY